MDRIHAILDSQGTPVAKGTLVHLIERAAALADAVDGEHWKQLKAGACLCFDGTGLKTLIVEQSKVRDGYLEVYTRDELTVIQFDLTKHADRLRERIDDYTGILVCDAESRNAAGAPNATFANCNAHPLRAFRDSEKSHPHRAAQGRRFIEALDALEDETAASGRPRNTNSTTSTTSPGSWTTLRSLSTTTRASASSSVTRSCGTPASSPEASRAGTAGRPCSVSCEQRGKCGVDVMAYLTSRGCSSAAGRTARGSACPPPTELTPMAYRDRQQALDLAA